MPHLHIPVRKTIQYITAFFNHNPHDIKNQLWKITFITTFSCSDWWGHIHLIPLSFLPKASLHRLSPCSLKSFHNVSPLSSLSQAFWLLSSLLMLLVIISLGCCLSLHPSLNFWERPLIRIFFSSMLDEFSGAPVIELSFTYPLTKKDFVILAAVLSLPFL